MHGALFCSVFFVSITPQVTPAPPSSPDTKKMKENGCATKTIESIYWMVAFIRMACIKLSQLKIFVLVGFIILILVASITIKPSFVTSSVITKSSPPPSRETLQQRFPTCFPPKNNYTSIKKFLDDLHEAKFILRDRNTPRPRQERNYDHMCFIMKARYNCALPPGSNNTTQAGDYKFIYQHKKDGGDWKHQQLNCDLDDVIGWVGGPMEIGRALAESSRDKISKQRTAYQVLLQGSSKLRQVIESLICKYTDQITNLTLTFGSQNLGLDAIQHLKKKYNTTDPTHIIRAEEIGQPRMIGIANESDGFMSYPELQHKGCHGNGITSMDKFYFPGVDPMPTSLNGCSDDFIMVEFGQLRFYYLFRPYLYSDDALLSVYDKLGMTVRFENATGNYVLDGIDVLVWNLNQPSVRLQASERQKKMLSYRWDYVPEHMQKVQTKTIGTFFGANNPFVTKPPDTDHGCMPGYPDDMVNIMLFSLLGGMTSSPV